MLVMEDFTDSSTDQSEYFADVPKTKQPKKNSKKEIVKKNKKSEEKNSKIDKEAEKTKPKRVEEKNQDENGAGLINLPIQAVIKPTEARKIKKLPNIVKDHLKQRNHKISKSQKTVPKITEGNKV
jgi:hypothetical protein